ncbi:MAG: cytochrome c [Phycisphaerales bacterium]
MNLGCRGDRSDEPPRQFFPDMDDSPKWRPQTQTEFFADGRAMRLPPEHTVAWGRWAFTTPDALAQLPADLAAILDRPRILREDDALFRGIQSVRPDGKPVYVDRIPITVDAALLKRGQERFNIYCAVCHGYQGRGEGMVGQRWTGNTVANFHDPKYTNPQEPDQKNTDGFIFDTAMRGVPGPDGFPAPGDDAPTRAAKLKALKMPSYAHALSERDGWAVVAYIRALQLSQAGSVNDVPQDQRQRLEDERRAMPPPAPTGPTGATGATGPTAPPGPGGGTGR